MDSIIEGALAYKLKSSISTVNKNERSHVHNQITTYISAVYQLILSQGVMVLHNKILSEFPDDYFVAGYIYGLSDAAIQTSIFDKIDNETFSNIIMLIFLEIYGEKGENLFNLVLLFSEENDANDPRVADTYRSVCEGIRLGGNEYFKWIKSEFKIMPKGLWKWLLDEKK